MKLLDEVPVDTGTSDFTFDTSKTTWMISCRHSSALHASSLSLHSLNRALDGWKCLAVPEIE